MRLSLFHPLLAAAWIVSALPSAPDVQPSRVRVPGAFIFELEDGQDPSDFENAVGGHGHKRRSFDYQLFKGVSVQLHDVDNAEARARDIASTSAVKAAWPVEVMYLPSDERVWAGDPSRKTGNRLGTRGNDTDAPYSPHVMVQVDKLKAEGITGKGVKIAVIDSGIDYTHPDLGGCFGEGCLVAFGTDFVGDDFNGLNEPIPDDDPRDCDREGGAGGHGTHVAGIISARPNNLGFTGAAPDAVLGSYRVFGCSGASTTEVLIDAFNQAYEDGADIISASIVLPSGWADETWSLAVSRIVEKGVPCLLAASNWGAIGMFFGSAAAGGRGVTAVSSFDNTVFPNIFYLGEVSVDGGEEEEFGYAPGMPSFSTRVRLPLWAPDLDPTSPASGCSLFPEDTPDLSEYIVLVRRGTCLFSQKAQNAVAFGAKYMAIYNTVPSVEIYNVDGVGIEGSLVVTSDVGEAWIELLAAGSKVVLDVTAIRDAETVFSQVPNDVSPGAPSEFTSWGPSYNVDVKPQYGTPGGTILSTYPVALGKYAVISGTSMATPLMAAIYALIHEVRGTLDPGLLEKLFSSTADPQLFHDTFAFSDFLAPVPQQGAGLVRAYDAAYATTIVEPASLSFNDTANFVDAFSITIQNLGEEEITYDISHVPTVSMYTLEQDSIFPMWFPNEIADTHASLEFGDDQVTVPAGGSLAVDVAASPPAGLTATRLPVYSGYIAINGSDGSSFSVPYQGIAGTLREATVLGPQGAWISKSSDATMQPVPANTTFTLPPPGTTPTDSSYVVPRLTASLALGSSILRADAIPLHIGSSNTSMSHGIGQPKEMPLRYLARYVPYFVDWYGELDDGSFAPAGAYKVAFRALRIMGDADTEADWDVVETVAFHIAYDE